MANRGSKVMGLDARPKRRASEGEGAQPASERRQAKTSPFAVRPTVLFVAATPALYKVRSTQRNRRRHLRAAFLLHFVRAYGVARRMKRRSRRSEEAGIGTVRIGAAKLSGYLRPLIGRTEFVRPSQSVSEHALRPGPFPVASSGSILEGELLVRRAPTGTWESSGVDSGFLWSSSSRAARPVEAAAAYQAQASVRSGAGKIVDLVA